MHRPSRHHAAVILAACLAGLHTIPPAAADGNNPGGLLPVPRATIFPGDRVSREMLTDKHFYFDPSRTLPVLDDAAPIIGKVARRTLVAGKPIPRNSFGEPDLVTRGTLTEARFLDGTLTISATVVPMESGALGALVQVRNIDSGRIISGTVMEDGSVRVGGR